MKPNLKTALLLSLTLPLAHAARGELVHRYPFDETTGTTAEDAVGDADGTIGSIIQLGQNGRINTAFKFPAAAGNADSRVTLPAAVTPGTAFTMAAFVNLAGALGNNTQTHIISGNNGAAGRWNLGLNDIDASAGVDAELFWFHSGGVGAVNVTGFNFNNHLNEWVHVGITRAADGATTLYLNGVPTSAGNSTAALAVTAVGIGERPNAAQFQFNGNIDEVVFYNTALTAAEIATLAAQTSDSDNDGLPDDYEMTNFGSLDENGDGFFDTDPFNNRIEFLAGTDPADPESFPMGDSDNDFLDDGWEWLNFETLARDGYSDFDQDGSLDYEEFEAVDGILVTRNANGSVAGTVATTGSTDPKNPNSQPNRDNDGLPDGYEYIHFTNLNETAAGDFDLDTFTNGQEFLAGSNPARKASTPGNVHAVTRVAVAHATGVAEYSVTNGNWSLVKQIAQVPGGVFGVTGHPDGYLYATALGNPGRIIRIQPASGEVTTLATRSTGTAAAAGWNVSDAQGIEVGPDGALYFSTAFGAAAGEGVFRLTTDGIAFSQFIAKTGGSEPANWDLNNSRDLEWSGGTLYVSARGGFNAVERPVYSFTSAGAYAATVANTLVGPQGLEVEEKGLLVTSSSTGTSGLYLIDLAGPFPAPATQVGAVGSVGGIDIIDLNGDTYYVNFNTGPGGVGQIIRRNMNGSLTVVVNALVSAGNDLAIFTSDLAGGETYESWAAGFGIDPAGPNGGPAGDFDGDGTRNEIERALGLSPVSGTSRFSITTSGTPQSGLTLTWPSAEGVVFEVHSSTNLTDWSTVEATVTGQAGQSTASWSAPAGAGKKFYRVQFQP